MNPLSLKDLLKGCLLVAFFENLPVLLLLIKRAALGIVQANLTLLSFAQPFPSGDKGCANRPFNSLYDPFGSPCRGQKRRSEPFHSMFGGPSEVYASSKLQFFVRDEPHRHTIQDVCCLLDAEGMLARCMLLAGIAV